MTGASTLAVENKSVLLDFAPEEPVSFSNLDVKTIKKELAKQLTGKERLLGELSGGGISRNVLQRQINQIKERLVDMEQIDELEGIDEDHRLQLESLERELSAVKSDEGTPLPMPRFFNYDSSSLLPIPANNSTPTKRRSKVPGNGKSNTDIEFATEIGQGLLIEVRKLQAALQNKEEVIKQLHFAKSDDERTTEMLMKHLKQKEESEERFKEQNWSLEVANEELRTNLNESNQTVSKAKIENTRLATQLRQVSEQNDALKAQVEKVAAASDNTKLRHEQDMQSLRRTIANLQRENLSCKEQVQSLTNELDIQRTKLSLRAVMTEGSSNDEKDKSIEPEKAKDVVPQASTSTPTISNNHNLELTTTKQSLNHAHRMINNLRTLLHKEKQEKHELKKFLSESQEIIEQLQHDIGNFSASPRNLTKTPKKVDRKSSRRTKSAGVKASMTAATEEMRNQENRFGRDVDDDMNDVGYSDPDPESEDALDDSASEKSFTHDVLDTSYMNNTHTGMQSLSLELANSQILQDQHISAPETSFGGTDINVENVQSRQPEPLKPIVNGVSVSVETEEFKPHAELSQHHLGYHEINPISQKSTLSTSTLDPLSALPAKSASASLQTSKHDFDNLKSMPRQRTLSTSTLEPLSETPVESNSTAMQNVAEVDAPWQRTLSSNTLEPHSVAPTISNGTAVHTAMQHVGETLYVPRQRTLSTSSLEPLSAPPALSNDTGIQMDTQYLVGVNQDSRQRNLSVATLQPLDLPPASLGNTEREATVLLLAEGQPVLQQRTISTSKLEPMSALPVQSDSIASQTISQNLAPLEVAPVPRQRTLSTSTLEPLNLPPKHFDGIAQTDGRTRDLRTSALESLSAPPAESSSSANQTSTQISSYEMIAQRSIDNHNDVSKADAGSATVHGKALKVRLQPPVDHLASTPEHTTPPDVMFDSNAQWSTTPDLSLGNLPVPSFTDYTERHSNDEADFDFQDETSKVLTQEPESMTISNQPRSRHPPVNAAVQIDQDKFLREDTTGTAVVFKDTGIHTSEEEPVEPVDSATSPINHFFPTDIHSARYVAGPNGEEMMTRKEAEALAAAYLADALSKDKAQFSSKRLAWEQGRLLKTSSMSFLNAPPRPERAPSPMLIAKTQKPLVAPKMHLSPNPKPSISTPVPSRNKGLRSSPSVSSIRSSMSKQSFTQGNESDRKEDYGHVIIRKGSMSILPSASTSLASSPTESMNELSLQRRPSLISQSSFGLGSLPTNLSVISAITKTMIGDWLWKYTRRTVGGGISEHRHRRFFWIHPYTRTLYWSTVEPGVDGSEALAKSAYVEAVMSVPNRSALNDCSASLLIKTPSRELKLTAPDMERHALWYKSLSYLLDRPTMEQPSPIASSIESVHRTQSTRLPRKPSFQRMQSLFSRSRVDDASINEETLREVKSVHEHEHNESDSETHEDVRQCCDGKHHIQELSQRGMPVSQLTKQ